MLSMEDMDVAWTGHEEETGIIWSHFSLMQKWSKKAIFFCCCSTNPSPPVWPHFVAYVSDLSTVPSKSQKRTERNSILVEWSGAQLYESDHKMNGFRRWRYSQSFDLFFLAFGKLSVWAFFHLKRSIFSHCLSMLIAQGHITRLLCKFNLKVLVCLPSTLQV